MSHHLDTPLAARTGQLYLDDLCVFPGQGSTVFVMDVNSDVNGLHSEPGFHQEARYEFKVHRLGRPVASGSAGLSRETQSGKGSAVVCSPVAASP
jgi:hypothetical protein